MNGRKRFLAAGTVLAVLAIGAALPAASQDRIGRTRAGIGLARLFQARQVIAGLNLTPDQKTQVKGILENNRQQILQITRDVVQGRLDLINGLPGASSKLAAAQLQAVNLRLQIFEQIRPILTPDQLSKVQKRQQLRQQRLQKLLDRLNEKISM